MANDSQNDVEQGLLDLAVELSTSDVTAGNEFAIFVLVKNPFGKPVWVREVNVSLPSELKRVEDQGIRAKFKEAEEKKEKQRQEDKEDRKKLLESIYHLEAKIDNLTETFSANDNESLIFTRQKDGLLSELSELRNSLKRADSGLTAVQIYNGAVVQTLRIGSESSEVLIYDGRDPDQNNPNWSATQVQQIEIYDPWFTYERQTQARTIELKSSLPDNTALKPGSTAVYTVVLNVKRALIFTPAKYRLQFYVNYAFQAEKQHEDGIEQATQNLYTNTIAHSLSIRPSVYSVITGSVLGSTVGATARLLQVPQTLGFSSTVVTLLLAIILGSMAVIFMARKSDTQSFISVEDFWGGILIGFLVGYTGTSFFENITGAVAPQPIQVNPNGF